MFERGFMEKYIEYVQSNKYIQAVKGAIIKLSGINIAISLILILAYAFRNMVGISSMYLFVGFNAYVYMLAGILSLLIAYELNQKYMDERVIVSALVIVAFIELSAPMLFLSSCVIVPLSYQLFGLLKRVRISSKHVPPSVIDYINGVLPSSCVVIGVFALSVCIDMSQLNHVLLTFTRGVASYPVVVLVVVATCVFWIQGVHGVAVFGMLLRPFWVSMLLSNMSNFLLGVPLEFIGSEGFLSWYAWFGGSGGTIGLALWYYIDAKQRTIGKEFLNAGIFNINENVIFGAPIVGSTYLKYAFVIVPLVNISISYWCISRGYVSPVVAFIPWVLPAPIGALLSSLLDLHTLWLVLVLFGVSFCIYGIAYHFEGMRKDVV